jgi:hypothetical protein
VVIGDGPVEEMQEIDVLEPVEDAVPAGIHQGRIPGQSDHDEQQNPKDLGSPLRAVSVWPGVCWNLSIRLGD